MKNAQGTIENRLSLYVIPWLMMLMAGVAGCQEKAKEAPESPVVSPEGPEITMKPGETQPIRANAARATRYVWTLQGKGQLSSSEGPATLFAAPEEGGSMAIVTVTAHNEHGDSPPTAITINIRATTSASLESLGIPAGWMSGNGQPASVIQMNTVAVQCHSDPGCLRFRYTVGGGWAGIYWWPLDCGESGIDVAWNRVRSGSCGIDVLRAGNFSAVERFTFWARGERGEETIEFKIGSPDVAPIPGRSTGRVSLKPTWERYQIDLQDIDMSKVIGLFLWTATDQDNPNGAVFYLDDIRFEGVK